MPLPWTGGRASTGRLCSIGEGGGVLGGFFERVDLFAFIADTDNLNETSDDTQPFRGGENVSCVCGFALRSGVVALRNGALLFKLFICNDDMGFQQSPFLFFAGLFCFRGDSFALSRAFWVFCRLSGWNYWSYPVVSRLGFHFHSLGRRCLFILQCSYIRWTKYISLGRPKQQMFWSHPAINI